LQFFRFVVLLEKAGAEVVLETDAALIPLLRPHLQGRVVQRAEETVDFQIPLMSLAGLFETGPDGVPPPLPFLIAPTDRLQHWQARLGPKSWRLRIGIACSGNAMHANDHWRSCPLEQFLPFCERAELYILQKQLSASDTQCLAQHPSLHFPGSQMGDFADTAAIVSQMDLVISVDTSLVHLAGTTGKEVWVMLPKAPDWRWMLDRSDSPWYPSAKLFRQNDQGDWRDVIQAMGKALAHL
jgi:hypothetical protein